MIIDKSFKLHVLPTGNSAPTSEIQLENGRAYAANNYVIASVPFSTSKKDKTIARSIQPKAWESMTKLKKDENDIVLKSDSVVLNKEIVFFDPKKTEELIIPDHSVIMEKLENAINVHLKDTKRLELSLNVTDLVKLSQAMGTKDLTLIFKPEELGRETNDKNFPPIVVLPSSAEQVDTNTPIGAIKPRAKFFVPNAFLTASLLEKSLNNTDNQNEEKNE